MIVPGFYVSTAKEKLNLPWVCHQIRNSYWGGWLDDARIIKSIEHSLCFGTYREDQMLDGGDIVVTGEQVGFGRVVTDGATFSSCMDIVIEEALRGRGLGSMLIDAMLAHPDVKDTINVISTADASLFYDKWNWQPAFGVMKRNPS